MLIATMFRLVSKLHLIVDFNNAYFGLLKK